MSAKRCSITVSTLLLAVVFVAGGCGEAQPKYVVEIHNNPPAGSMASTAYFEEQDLAIVELISPSGIGRADLMLEEGEWPERMVVCLKNSPRQGFVDCKRFTVDNELMTVWGGNNYNLVYVRENGRRWKPDRQMHMPVELRPDCVQVTIPPEVYANGARKLSMTWTDFVHAGLDDPVR